MKLLLDTHVPIWWLGGDATRMAASRGIIEDPDNIVLFSVVSLWEIVIKIRVGKLALDLSELKRAIDLEQLSIEADHLARLASLPSFHRDPFDHLLIAQAIAEDATLVSANAVVARYPVAVMRV